MLRPQKRSLVAQIQELDREIALREKVYPNLVSRRQMRQAEADEHMTRIRAARDSLKWMQENEKRIKDALGSAEN